ncbi:MAG: fructose-1,6-bisphosphatase [Oscillospiraceae bacterium]|nr:fructose-1,6-bisphosphatase [Oscillospiraceae bacterium]
MKFSESVLQENRKFLELLSQKYPTIQAASTEIINLQAIMNLPKGTEHFLSDIHGEYEPFLHILKNASGVIKNKVDAIFGNTITEEERRRLATLIYYPEEKLALLKKQGGASDDWYRITLRRLMEVCQVAASKYTRSKVRKALPADFEYIIDELLHSNGSDHNKDLYYEQIIRTIIEIDRADAFIVAMANLIQRLVIDHLHIIGDLFDRGPGAHILMDHLCGYHSVDIQWGNHDILWMGAAAGQEACIANVLTNCFKYNNFDTIEDGYGINVRPLATFAMETYGDDPCTCFRPKNPGKVQLSDHDQAMAARIHKAIAVIQFKLEGQVILRHPEYKMDDRLLLRKVNFEEGTVTLGRKKYPMRDTHFPTIDPKDPFALSEEEALLVEKLRLSFMHSEKLQRHVRFLFQHGSMYLISNGNLLYHGCIPMEADGRFSSTSLGQSRVSGRAYLDEADRLVRRGYYGRAGSPERMVGADFMWYLWCGPKSPLSGKDRITTFERYFVEDQTTWEEHKDPYYRVSATQAGANAILKEFGLELKRSKIINGHMPVKIRKGESPVKAGGKLLVIDGGLSRAYQPVTGIAGYTLTFNSREMSLAEHHPFDSVQRVVNNDEDMHSSTFVVEKMENRLMIRDTDNGQRLARNINDLEMLLDAYRAGMIKQK